VNAAGKKFAATAVIFLGLCFSLPAQNTSSANPVVDATTMNHKLLMGYQGWFTCPGDGSPPNRWVHWFRKNNPTATNATVDFWPDVSELDADELFPTQLKLSDGSPAKVYSAFTPKTVLRHFRWLQENNLDGVFLQRFTSELSDPAFFALRNRVAENVQAGAEKYGRTFAMMYDISGQRPETLVSALTNDWSFLTRTQHVTASPRYLRHNGKPVVAIWGFGFADRPGTREQARAVIEFFKASGCTVVGGVPIDWRKDPAWQSVFEQFDIISPWTVGAYADDAGADSYRERCIVPDLAAARHASSDYMPVIFPGFSWHNLNAGKPNQIPRRAGKLFWRQAFNAVNAGCPMIYCAMFDEVDEGTAMFKLAPTQAQLPVEGTFVPLDADGVTLPSDWYLRLANEAGKMLRGEILLTNQIPIAP
jgi:hypothetical protein